MPSANHWPFFPGADEMKDEGENVVALSGGFVVTISLMHFYLQSKLNIKNFLLKFNLWLSYCCYLMYTTQQLNHCDMHNILSHHLGLLLYQQNYIFNDLLVKNIWWHSAHVWPEATIGSVHQWDGRPAEPGPSLGESHGLDQSWSSTSMRDLSVGPITGTHFTNGCKLMLKSCEK